MDSASSPHDRFFKDAFGRVEAARGFFQNYLPATIADSIDWRTLQRKQGSFTDETLSERSSDLLFQVKWKEQPLFLHCLFEHQSMPDSLMPLRILRYMLRIWDQHIKENKNTIPLPMVIPIVLHQNQKQWNTHLSFVELFKLPDSAEDLLRTYIPDFSFHLIDLVEIPFDELRKRILHKTILYAMKLTRGEKPLDHLELLLPLLNSVMHDHHDPTFLRTVLGYLIRATDEVDLSRFRHTLLNINLKPIQDTAMTLHDLLIEEGRTEGHREGWRAGEAKGILVGEAAILERLFSRRFGELPESVSARLRAASQSDIELWSDRILDARSLDEVFG